MERSGREVIVFQVGESLFCLESQVVAEILTPPEVRAVPLAPAAVQGVINLRGEIVTVLDLAVQLGLESGAAAGAPVIVCRRGEEHVGLLVTEVRDVLAVEGSDFLPPPANLQAMEEFLLGVVVVEKDLVGVLEPGRLFA